ncbi:DUF4870 domain-containing protein [Cellulomonas carbonis]|uniref:DUF4870 domain-containing protein n=1 Tax=Cellulomonas carbonis T26 TaxID=947969 RepID=A0A0A0BV52_9CELL|nr:DUF4870 domain-containing protein [Cellulomonas carbonis]KGM11855.1 hypothetical protein N868_04770 [Cellulomonas carbonis T26]GGB91754.1 hypothetical protein GCM10010972_00500 [Cellulomonas carbonis]
MTTNPSDAQEPGVPPTPPPSGGAYPPPPGAGQVPPAGGYQQPGGYQQGAYQQGGYQQPGYGAPAGAPLSDSDQRMWATLAHIGGLLVSFVAPLVVWLVFKGRGQFVEDQAKEALNFQITLVIVGIAISIITALTLGLGAILYLVFIVALVFMILAAVAANRGQYYRYPANIRIIK